MKAAKEKTTMKCYPWIDMHCDSLLRAYRDGSGSLWDGEGHQSLKQLAESGQMCQFFAVYFRPKSEQQEEDIASVDNGRI